MPGNARSQEGESDRQSEMVSMARPLRPLLIYGASSVILPLAVGITVGFKQRDDVVKIKGHEASVGDLMHHNINVATFILMGTIAFGLPAIFCTANWFSIGNLIAQSIKLNGWIYTSTHLVPHAILELSGFIIASGASFTLTQTVIETSLGKTITRDVVQRKLLTWVKCALCSLVLIAVAATIEGTLSK